MRLRTLLPRFFLPLGLAAAGPVTCLGEATADAPEVSDSALRIRGIFDAALPGTERKNSLRLIFHPHLGDLMKRDHLRTPLGLRYGLTRNWEVTGEVETYFSHGLKATGLGKNWGLSQMHLGTKYRLGDRRIGGWETALGFDYTRPLGAPPLEVTDGLEHFAPYVTFARPLPARPDMRVFWGVGADLVNRTDIPGELRRNQLGDDAARLSGGVVWHLGAYHYTLEMDWATTDGFGGPAKGNVINLRPAVVYELPPHLRFGAKGQWLVGLGLRATHGPDGMDYGASAKVRVNFDLKRLWRGRK